jgi:hypothetical protein
MATGARGPAAGGWGLADDDPIGCCAGRQEMGSEHWQQLRIKTNFPLLVHMLQAAQ